jgi:hypothetical protein
MSLGISLGLSLRSSGLAGFSPLSLFEVGEDGYWLDPSGFSTMFQDDAGVTPVTDVGQSVRRILDKSQGGPGRCERLDALRHPEKLLEIIGALEARVSELEAVLKGNPDE